MSATSDRSWQQAIYDRVSGRNANSHGAASAPEAETTLASASLLHVAPVSTTLAATAVLNPGLVRATASTAVIAIPNRISPDVAKLTRPVWTADRLPTIVMPPTPAVINTITVSKFILWPDLVNNIAYVGPTEVALLSFSLTIKKSVLPDRGVAITGGSAIITVSVYATGNLESLSVLRRDWNVALTNANIGARVWTYLPQQRRSIVASLELPAGVASSAPQVLTSPISGTATFLLELTEAGALSWQSALQQKAAATLGGICRVSVTTLSARGAAITVNRQTLDTTLGTLLAGGGPEDIRIVDPQQTVHAKLIIVPNDLISTMIVALHPNQGQAPVSQTFGPPGGEVDASVSTQQVESVSVDWTAQVAFTPAHWPPLPASGRLNAANIWTDMIKPDSWVETYTFMAIPVDDRGQAQDISTVGQDYHAQGSLNFTAPYVANGVLNSSFEADALRPVTVALPFYPGQPPGTLLLTMFATRNGKGGTATRRLNTGELNVVALIYPDARIEIKTGQDALAEDSTASDSINVLGAISA